MQIKDIFKDIFKGLRIEKDNNIEEKITAYLIDTKDVKNCSINYLNSSLQEIGMKVKEKYYLKPGDIIIATIPSEKTCHVGYCPEENGQVEYNRRAIIKKNFIVLRNPISDYKSEFVAEYLEMIGISEYFSKNKITYDKYDNKKKKEALTIEDIEKIEVPNISLDKQIELLSLINPINQRSSLYQKLIQNDLEIKKHMIKEMLGNEK